MDGLKEIRQGAALPAVDAACPGSLEISGHCLAAARVIAWLLVGPEKKRAQDKRVMYKNREGGKRREEINSQIFHRCRDSSHFHKIAFTPNLQRLAPRWIHVLITSHRAVIKNKQGVCGEQQERMEGEEKTTEAVDPVELTCLVCAQLKYPLLSANYCYICIFIISI